MNKSTIIKEITSTLCNEFKSDSTLKTYLKKLKELNKEGLINLLGVVRENSSFDFNSKKWVSKPIDTLLENNRVMELSSYIRLEELSNLRNFYKEQNKIIEIDNLLGFVSDDITDMRKEKKIKSFNNIHKIEYGLTSGDYKQRKGLLVDSMLNYPKSLSFFGHEFYTIGYEYKSGSTEIYGNLYKSLTIIITDLYNTGILSSEDTIKKICTSLYNDTFLKAFDPVKILWLVEIPISKNKSKFYEITFKTHFEFKLRYEEEVSRINRIYSMNLQNKENITIFTGIDIKKLKNLNQVITLHKLKSVLSYENIGAI